MISVYECGYLYDEKNEKAPWEELPDSWRCPLCGNTVEGEAPDTGPICNVDLKGVLNHSALISISLQSGTPGKTAVRAF